MPTAAISPSEASVTTVSLRERLLNVFANPGDVFEEIVTQPYSRPNWLVPTLLVCFVGIASLLVAPVGDTTTTPVHELVGAGAVPTDQDQTLVDSLPLAAALTVISSAFFGTFWSAFVVWFIARVFLRARFPFLKAVEVVGLSSMVLVLGVVVTSLLIVASGDATARAALSLFVRGFNPADKLHSVLSELSLFHLWATAVLAVGLSKLSRVSFKEAGFWVFGYWLALRLSLNWF